MADAEEERDQQLKEDSVQNSFHPNNKNSTVELKMSLEATEHIQEEKPIVQFVEQDQIMDAAEQSESQQNQVSLASQDKIEEEESSNEQEDITMKQQRS